MSNLVLALTVFLCLTAVPGIHGVRIVNLSVPAAVHSNLEEGVVLDCDYTLESDEDAGLVVKWFFGDDVVPVYQWIVGRQPQVLGVLKGKVNPEYQASDNPMKKYRAIKIESLSRELSGVYSCHVSTFQGEDSQSKRMLVYTPPSRITLTHETDGENVTIRCEGIGAYPKPSMNITTSDPTNFPLVAERKTSGNLYNIKASITFKSELVPVPTTIDCALDIPEANYTVHQAMLYRPGKGLSR